MTMPSKIYAGHHGYGTYWQTNVSEGDAIYIRADIAEELARALAWLYQGKGDYYCPEAALAKYHQAIDTQEPSV